MNNHSMNEKPPLYSLYPSTLRPSYWKQMFLDIKLIY